MAMTAWKRVLFAGVAVSLSAAIVAVILLGMDAYLHSRVQNDGGVNVWGYRGPSIGSKAAGEIRVAVFGGSTAFGYGVRWDEAFPYYLQSLLNRAAHGNRHYVVVNLGAPAQGAFGLRFDLADYAYLAYDVAILYEGYNDLGATDLPNAVPPRDAVNTLLWRRQSPVFRATGYMPILPLVFREKAMKLRSGGQLDAAYRGRVEFKPGLAARASAGALQTAAAIAESLGTTIGRVTGDPALAAQAGTLDTNTWRHYTDNVLAAVRFARARSVKVVVVTQPYASDAHIAQQRALAEALAAAFGKDDGVKYVNLGTAIDLRDRRIAYDGLHLVPRGNELVAEALVPAVLEMLPKR
jgi:lysophospholipase L1-like esterase